MTVAEATPELEQRRPQRPRLPRPSQGPRLSRLHRGVRALLLLRHAGAAGPLHGQVPAAARAMSRMSPASSCSAARVYGGLERPAARLARSSASIPALVYLTPILGGILADRVLGRTRTIIDRRAADGGGHFLMAFEVSFLFALLCLMLGVGCFKGNIASQVGELYGPTTCAAPTPSRSSTSASTSA